MVHGELSKVEAKSIPAPAAPDENEGGGEEPEVVLRQLDAKPQGGRPEGGTRAAARTVNITEVEARRAEKIAAIVPEAQEAAVEAGLDDNQSALLRIAAKPFAKVSIQEGAALGPPSK
jgi:hypothetical protein